MNRQPEHGTNGFVVGLITGGIVGAVLALVFEPWISAELRRAKVSAADLKAGVSERYGSVVTRAVAVADGLTAKGEAVRDEVADAVGRRAREVEQFAMASKTRS